MPAVSAYVKELSDAALAKEKACLGVPCVMEKTLITKLSEDLSDLFLRTETLEEKVATAKGIEDKQEQANFYHDEVLSEMDEIRRISDGAEVYMPKEKWPFPTYGDLLFSIQ